jgi:hypothetical protein
MRWLVDIGPPTRKLDVMLADEFLSVGPVVAIGDPDRRGRHLFGAARAFPVDDHPGEDKWRTIVAGFAREATAIVVCVQRDPRSNEYVDSGIDWELRHIGSSGLGAKTLWLVHPMHRKKEENARLWRIIGARAGFDATPITDGGPALGAFQAADGSWCVARSRRFQSSAYLATLRWYFRLDRGAASGAGG